jgi:GT2 family glycosyltransferase
MNYDFIYSDLVLVQHKNKNYRVKKQKVTDILSFLKYPVGSGTVFKKKLWTRVGGFDENLQYQDDYDFWLKINNLDYIKIGYLEKPLYYYRFHSTNMSKNFIKKNITKITLILKHIFKL